VRLDDTWNLASPRNNRCQVGEQRCSHELQTTIFPAHLRSKLSSAGHNLTEHASAGSYQGADDYERSARQTRHMSDRHSPTATPRSSRGESILGR
jgi:hypothetical protein